MQTSIHSQIAVTLLSLAGLTVGCSNHGQVELLESRLRDQEDQLESLRNEVESQQHETTVAKEEAKMLRAQLAANKGQSAIQLTSGVSRVSKISINKSMTGFLDNDDNGVADRLMVLIQPRDERGNIVEVTGALHVKFIHAQQTVREWKFTADETLQQWRGNKLGTGIMLELDLDRPPTEDNYEITAQLRTIDDRKFDASRTVKSK